MELVRSGRCNVDCVSDVKMDTEGFSLTFSAVNKTDSYFFALCQIYFHQVLVHLNIFKLAKRMTLVVEQLHWGRRVVVDSKTLSAF